MLGVQKERENVLERSGGDTRERLLRIGKGGRTGDPAHSSLPICGVTRGLVCGFQEGVQGSGHNREGCMVHAGRQAPDGGPGFKHLALSRQVVENVKREGISLPVPFYSWPWLLSPTPPDSMKSLLLTGNLLCPHGQFKFYLL